jgi:hypothetical protein
MCGGHERLQARLGGIDPPGLQLGDRRLHDPHRGAGAPRVRLPLPFATPLAPVAMPGRSTNLRVAVTTMSLADLSDTLLAADSHDHIPAAAMIVRICRAAMGQVSVAK